jgi:hypothetical protein
VVFNNDALFDLGVQGAIEFVEFLLTVTSQRLIFATGGIILP